MQAIVAGRLSEIRVSSGATAKVGEVLAVVGDGAAKAVAGAEAPVTKPPPWRPPFDEVSTPTDRFGSAKGPNGVSITPLARRLIAQHGLDLAVLAAEAERRGAKKIDEAAVRAAISAASGYAYAVARPGCAASDAFAATRSGTTTSSS